MRGSTTAKNPLAIITVLLILAGSSFVAAGAFCQTPAREARRPFDRLTLTVHAVQEAALGSFADLWEPSPGLRVEVATPVHTGIANAGVLFFHHRALDPSVPDFGCVEASLGWAYDWDLWRRLSFAAGVDVAVSYMMFDDESTARARQEETELGFGAVSRAAYEWTARWSLVLSGGYRKTLTRYPIEYVFVGVGLGRTFSTPSWLREFLE